MAQLSTKLGWLTVALVFVTGCSTLERNETLNKGDLKVVHELSSVRATEPSGEKIESQEFESIPIEVNNLVEKWIAYFQGRGKPHMERYLARSTRYSSVMKKILRQNGLPEDLLYIAMIESGFSSKAYSSAAAVGYWQFIRGTGRRYGLEINPLVDERRDPILSTQAAAEYFKGLYSVFGSWYLAMASYNVGENRVKKEVMNHYTRDFWELARKRRLPKETINYIPKFIAAKMIGNNPKKYGFTEVDYLAPIEFDLIKIDKPVNLKKMAELLNYDYDEFKLLNPKFKGEVAPLTDNKLELRVPVGDQSKALAAASQSYVDKVEYVADAGETQIHRVRSGESLYSIARKYRTTVVWLKDVNDLKRGRKLRIGQKLFVPDRTGVVLANKALAQAKKDKKEDLPEAKEAATQTNEIVAGNVVYYIVQNGDNLTTIANEYDSSVEELRKMNKLSKRALLKVGMKLKVPKDEGLPTDPNAKPEESSKIERAEAEGAGTPTAREPGSESDYDGKQRINDKILYRVRKGENLTEIAKKYGMSVRQLAVYNDLPPRVMLKAGTRLEIPVRSKKEVSQRKAKPKSKFHVVRRGENLTKIADRYQISLQELKNANRLKSGSKVLAGMRLLVPL